MKKAIRVQFRCLDSDDLRLNWRHARKFAGCCDIQTSSVVAGRLVPQALPWPEVTAPLMGFGSTFVVINLFEWSHPFATGPRPHKAVMPEEVEESAAQHGAGADAMSPMEHTCS